jgi:hypothetical protein
MKEERTKEIGNILKNPPEPEGDEKELEKKEADAKDGKAAENKPPIKQEAGEENKSAVENDEDEESSEEDEESGSDESEEDDRWRGKTREEVIRMFEEIEKKNKPDNLPKPPAKEEDKPDKENEFGVPSDEELAKMTPKQFAQWMMDNVKNIVGKTYDARNQIRDSVAQEIRETQKDHPLLRTSAEYRELVLAVIESASQKGVMMPLKEACAKVDAFAGKVQGDTKVSDDEAVRLKKAKAQVEKGAGAPISPGEEKGDEVRRLEGIFGSGGTKSPMGGLGI